MQHVRPRKLTGAKLPIGYAPEFRGHSRSTTRTPTNIFGGKASTISEFLDLHLPLFHLLVAAAVQMSAEIAKESWQCKWNHGFTGYYTRMLIPTVGVKLFFPSSRDIGISYCRMLLHDTMLMEDSFRTGTSDSPLCECGVECESVEHFLLCCPIHETARKEMITNIIINTVWSSSKCKRRLNMSANLLLAPHWDSQISKIQDKYIKLALFDFLTSVDQKL